MNFTYYTPELEERYRCVLLTQDVNHDEIHKTYLEGSKKYIDYDLIKDNLFVIETIKPEGRKKVPVKDIKEWFLNEIVPSLEFMKTSHIIVSDVDFYKALTGNKNGEDFLGYSHPCRYDNNFTVSYIPNYKNLYLNPQKIGNNILIAMRTLNKVLKGTYTEPGKNVVQNYNILEDVSDIKEYLEELTQYEGNIYCDIEAFSLRHYDAGIGSIAFSTGNREGTAFLVDYIPQNSGTSKNGFHGYKGDAKELKELLKEFFINKKGTVVFHNITYDYYVLVYALFMKDILDQEGLLKGLECLLGDLDSWECTKLITYLATNSVSGNELGLKPLARELLGNWSEEVDNISDIRTIPHMNLLKYNIEDAIATEFVYDTYHPVMLEDNQNYVYQTIFKPAVLDVIQMQLTGMPIDIVRAREVNEELESFSQNAINSIMNNPLIEEFLELEREDYIEHRNSTLKTKQIGMEEAIEKVSFNPNSSKQVGKFLFDFLELPVHSKTASGNPATGTKVLENLLDIFENIENINPREELIKDFLKNLVDFKAVIKVLTSFMPAIMNSKEGKDGWHYMFGFFNIGGTVSGRLSSNNPNMQNLPAKGPIAKMVQSCFAPPPGWVFVGLDFDALEDKISALTTGDPNKLKVYIDGFDAHCLNTYNYFKEEFPDLDPESPDSINSIKVTHEALRDRSKAPTFLLTYKGTMSGLMRLGFDSVEANQIYERYQNLYKHSIAWVKERVDNAMHTGYVECAFGLRVRTHVIAQTILGNRRTPAIAESEARTAGNALGQSWCMLNNRAASDFMNRVRSDNRLRNLIRPCAHIHDSQFYLIKESPEILKWVNDNLVDAVEWQDHPDIQHDQVKLGGKLSLYHPDWSNEVPLPNYADIEELVDIAQNIEVKE